MLHSAISLAAFYLLKDGKTRFIHEHKYGYYFDFNSENSVASIAFNGGLKLTNEKGTSAFILSQGDLNGSGLCLV